MKKIVYTAIALGMTLDAFAMEQSMEVEKGSTEIQGNLSPVQKDPEPAAEESRVAQEVQQPVVQKKRTGRTPAKRRRREAGNLLGTELREDAGKTKTLEHLSLVQEIIKLAAGKNGTGRTPAKRRRREAETLSLESASIVQGLPAIRTPVQKRKKNDAEELLETEQKEQPKTLKRRTSANPKQKASNVVRTKKLLQPEVLEDERNTAQMLAGEVPNLTEEEVNKMPVVVENQVTSDLEQVSDGGEAHSSAEENTTVLSRGERIERVNGFLNDPRNYEMTKVFLKFLEGEEELAQNSIDKQFIQYLQHRFGDESVRTWENGLEKLDEFLEKYWEGFVQSISSVENLITDKYEEAKEFLEFLAEHIKEDSDELAIVQSLRGQLETGDIRESQDTKLQLCRMLKKYWGDFIEDQEQAANLSAKQDISDTSSDKDETAKNQTETVLLPDVRVTSPDEATGIQEQILQQPEQELEAASSDDEDSESMQEQSEKLQEDSPYVWRWYNYINPISWIRYWLGY